MRILIVEDEILSQEELTRLLKMRFPLFEIVGLTKSIKSTIEFLKENSVDLIFMDIELSDGNSLSLFEEIEITVPVIFTTAYEQYALKAFQTSGVSYLLKPIRENDLLKAVEKVNLLKTSNISYEDRIKNILSSSFVGYKERILVKYGDQMMSVSLDDVAYFYAEDRICFVVTKINQRYFVDYTLDMLEKTLDPSVFFRITRNCITSIGSIKQISKFFNSRLKIKLEPSFVNEDLVVSRARVVDFMKWLDGEV